MISEEEANERAQSGWFKVWLAFEAVAVKPEVVRSALENLINKLDSDQKVKIYKKEFLDVREVTNPIKGIEKAWAQIVNIEFVTKNFFNLVQTVIEYGPSAIEILSPQNFELKLSEAQDIVNNVAGMMHRFAAAGIGGTIIQLK